MNSKIQSPYLAILLSVGLGLLICEGVSAAETKESKAKKTNQVPPAKPSVPPAPVATASPQPALSLNPVAQGAAKQGVKSCLKRINQVTSFIASNANAGAFLFPASPPDADQHVFSTSMEIVSPNALGYASANFAPVGSDGCGAIYDAVTYWNLNCGQTAAAVFPQLKPAGLIKQNIQILEGGATIRVFLMPAGQGCVAIKKEVVY